MRFSAPSFFTHTHSPDLSALLLCTWSQSICPYCPYSNTKSAIQVPNMQYKLYCSNAVDEACVLKQTKFRKKKEGDQIGKKVRHLVANPIVCYSI